MRQITDTIDYTEVQTDGTKFYLVRHERILGVYNTEAEALAAYKAIVSRPGRGDYR